MMPEAGASWSRRMEKALARLAGAGIDEAETKLRWLAGHLLGCGLLDVERHGGGTPTAEQGESWMAGVERLAGGEPVQYVVGETDFLGFRIRCDRRALIPRPETELLALAAEEYLSGLPGTPTVVDACTGTGCIACALALRVPSAHVLATDLSAEALALAKENAAALGARVECRQADLLKGIPRGTVDLVVSNPPYVSTEECERLEPTVKDFEPRMALDGGKRGMETISRLVSQAADVILPGGRLMMEIGEDQADAVRETLCRTSQFNQINLRRDYAGQMRLVLARRTF